MQAQSSTLNTADVCAVEITLFWHNILTGVL